MLYSISVRPNDNGTGFIGEILDADGKIVATVGPFGLRREAWFALEEKLKDFGVFDEVR